MTTTRVVCAVLALVTGVPAVAQARSSLDAAVGASGSGKRLEEGMDGGRSTPLLSWRQVAGDPGVRELQAAMRELKYTRYEGLRIGYGKRRFLVLTKNGLRVFDRSSLQPYAPGAVVREVNWKKEAVASFGIGSVEDFLEVVRRILRDRDTPREYSDHYMYARW